MGSGYTIVASDMNSSEEQPYTWSQYMANDFYDPDILAAAAASCVRADTFRSRTTVEVGRAARPEIVDQKNRDSGARCSTIVASDMNSSEEQPPWRSYFPATVFYDPVQGFFRDRTLLAVQPRNSPAVTSTDTTVEAARAARLKIAGQKSRDLKRRWAEAERLSQPPNGPVLASTDTTAAAVRVQRKKLAAEKSSAWKRFRESRSTDTPAATAATAPQSTATVITAPDEGTNGSIACLAPAPARLG